jgi:hypothetical protein
LSVEGVLVRSPLSSAVVGWLVATGQPGPAWPGVLLHPNAFLVRAPREILVKAPSLLVLIESAASTTAQHSPAEAAELLPVQTVKVLEVDGWPDEPATAMVRLAVASGIDRSTEVNRAGFDIAVRVTGDVWVAFESLGLIPDGLAGREPLGQPAPTSPPASTEASVRTSPLPTSTVETVSVEPARWCDIFWWLC